LDEQSKAKRFEEVFVVHLDAAYNLARWLTRDESNADDVVQEACLRAFKFFDGFHGENGRAWLLAIVRNTYYTWLEKNRSQMLNVPLDEDILAANSPDVDAFTLDANHSVERSLEGEDNRRLVNNALDQLPLEFREVIILRELEDMSYKEIATVANIPIGTVMSRLARARKLLLQHLRQANLES
jgi:RNA polymerase sigma-70 factor (ECF subfamily)